MYIGKCEGKSCNIASDSPNDSIIITGISGSGKSCRQNQIELETVKNGDTVLVIDASKNHLEKDIFFKIQDVYFEKVNRINVEDDGLGLNLLTPLKNSKGKMESAHNLIFSAVSMLSATQRFGVRQQALLRSAIEQAIIVKNKCKCTDSEALEMVFTSHMKSVEWLEMYQRLWGLLESGILRDCTKVVEPQKINIIDFAGFDISFSEKVAEMVLINLWRYASGSFLEEKYGRFIVVIDEFQHCDLGKNSILRTILREGRKFGLNLMLVTQSLEIFTPPIKAMLGQMATHLCFKPAENEIMKQARMINPERAREWREKLVNLKVGECIAIGDKEVAGVKISRPLKLC